jgi:hypothetical protein
MHPLLPNSPRHPALRCFTRRELLLGLARGGAAALAAPSLLELIAAPALAASGRFVAPARAKRLVLLWLEGGPSQMDTFDPKPGVKQVSPLRTLPTELPGVEFSEYLPNLARAAPKLSVIRTLTSREGTHSRARELLHNGFIPNPSVRYPSIGSITAHELADPEGALPAFIQIGGVAPSSNELGAASEAFWIETAGAKVENLPPGGAPRGPRAARRESLRQAIDAAFAAAGGGEVVARNDAQRQRALRLMDSRLLEVLRSDQESEALRDRYGRNPFGEGVLLARRLIEAGVTAIEVQLPGWDTHSDNFNRTGQLCQQLDPAFATLVDDLEKRGLLAETLVVCMGEFGRTPKLVGGDGRHHWATNFCAVMAGGGTRPATVIGTTDPRGESIVDRPVKVADLFATFATLLGIDGKREYTTTTERTIPLIDPDGKPVRELLP